MNEFRTTFKIPESSLHIDHQTPVAMIGSCFTDNIGNLLERYKFRMDINPFGVIYNPASVANSLNFLANRAQFGKVDLHYFSGKWFSFYHSTAFSGNDAGTALQKINDRLAYSSEFIRNAQALFITLGTAWIYKHKKEQIIVSNNHKLPSNQFKRYRLNVDDTVMHLAQAIQRVREVNPSVRIIFTISPVRHWKDGPVENQLSKSTLIVAVHELITRYSATEYFPAYEIMMDDLRGYRFYDDDMIHLGNQAIGYIWEKFRKVYINPQAEVLMNKLKKLVKAMEHRPVNSRSEEFRAFADKNLKRIEQLEQQYPFLDFSKEKAYFSKFVK